MEWTVVSSDGSCAACGRKFAEREEYCSVLSNAGEGFSRKDYCLECWKGPGAETFSFWRTRSKLKPAPAKRFVGDEVLIDFFERLCTSDDASKGKFRFIMAVLLMRKRLLKERSRRRTEAGLIWTVEVPRLGKTFEVEDQGLSEGEIAALLGEIGQVLNLELSEKDATAA